MKVWRGGAHALFTGHDTNIPHGAVVKLVEKKVNRFPFQRTVFASGGSWVHVRYNGCQKSIRREYLELCDPPSKRKKQEPVNLSNANVDAINNLLGDLHALVGPMS